MKPYPLTAILALRVQKEDEAQKKLSIAHAVEAQRRDAVTAAQQALTHYLDWNQKETERLFATILGAPHSLHKITETTNQISWNRSQQATYVVALEEAQKKLQAAVVETVARLQEQQDAYKEVWKIDKHQEMWMKEEEVREEKEEEDDMEETAATIYAMNQRLRNS
ncbi:MAG: hypothetical protein A3F67_10690 [Verrucomicrobia bacterium RIFCSPHIGHO2_12_FULL_41_10]|nr:MAG: hypothetical protein A3F67_10690 [Verrucomicrobia bacterium RIFCSPHIGHO2_12_FULL_41_10]HLB34587.1 YscO family type III secretion system apparatus protein [Chthoniobacterales bacterium]